MATRLIQRMIFGGKSFATDYMGAAEFEFGALPHTFNIWKNLNEEKKIVGPLLFESEKKFYQTANMVDPNEKKCWIVGTEAGIENAKAIFSIEIEGQNYSSLKEPTYIFKSYKGTNKYVNSWVGVLYSNCRAGRCNCDINYARLQENIFGIFRTKEAAEMFMKQYAS